MHKRLTIFTFRRSFNTAIADDSLKISDDDLNDVIKLATADYSSAKSIESLRQLIRWPKGTLTVHSALHTTNR